MTTQKFSNFAQGTLQANILAADTSLKVNPTNEFPLFPTLVGSDNFICTIFDGVQTPEVVNVTAATTGTFTIARAQEGTTANNWNAGSVIRLAPTAAMLQTAANYASNAGLTGTSATSFAIGTGSKSFTTQANLQFNPGMMLMIASSANPANYMHGQITSYSSTTLVMNILDVGGSGTHTDWKISISGTQGPTGATGATGSAGTNGTNGAAGTNGTNGVVPIANAGGSADALTATFNPAEGNTDLTLISVVPTVANITTAPNLSVNGGTAKTITKFGAIALALGDLQPNCAAFLEYNAAVGGWVLLNPAGNTATPPGTMSMFGASVAPTGWLECNGQAVSRTTYAPLFAVIGTTWGAGDASTTFNIPDMRGYFPRGWDDGAGVDTGRSFASTQADAFKSHTHTATVTDTGHTHTFPGAQRTAFGGGSNPAYDEGTGGPTATNSAVTGVTVANASTGGTETRPINKAVMFIIKT